MLSARPTPSAGLASLIDHRPPPDDFRAALLQGLAQADKAIPCRFLYDARGSSLFDAICEQPEYYPTRTELAILTRHAPEMAALAGPAAHLVELGSGSAIKVSLLLDALERPAAYVAVDISREHLVAASSRLAEAYPAIAVHAVCADFAQPFDLPPLARGEHRVAFYPGSTIGNSTPLEAAAFLKLWRKRLGPDGAMIVGVDLKKDPATLNAAYNDAAGVTAAFTENIRVRANREAGADFDLGQFAHHAVYDEAEGAVVIHLRARTAQTVRIGDRAFPIAAGELIHVENSYKYSLAGFRRLAESAGFFHRAAWTDAASLFSVHYLSSTPFDSAHA